MHEESVHAEGAGNPGETVLAGEDARRGEVELVDPPEHEADDNALDNKQQRGNDPDKHKADDAVPACLVEPAKVIVLVETIPVAVALVAVEKVAVAQILLTLLTAGLAGPHTFLQLLVFGLLGSHVLPRADNKLVVVFSRGAVLVCRDRKLLARLWAFFAVAVVECGRFSRSSCGSLGHGFLFCSVSLSLAVGRGYVCAVECGKMSKQIKCLG